MRFTGSVSFPNGIQLFWTITTDPPYIWRPAKPLTFRITSLSSLVSASATSFVLWRPGSIEPSTAGLILTYATTVIENIIFLVQLYAETQQGFNSIERIDEYLTVP